MQRRSFVKSSVLAAAAGAIMPELSKASGHKKERRQFYELRYYTLKDAAQQQLVTDYFKNAFIPALNQAGSSPVGLFTELRPQGQTGLYALIPYNNWGDFMKVQDLLANDTDYQRKGSDYLNAPATSPAYERIESWLLESFTHFPQLQAPAAKPRIFELRRYEHASESAGEKKLEMFN